MALCPGAVAGRGGAVAGSGLVVHVLAAEASRRRTQPAAAKRCDRKPAAPKLPLHRLANGRFASRKSGGAGKGEEQIPRYAQEDTSLEGFTAQVTSPGGIAAEQEVPDPTESSARFRRLLETPEGRIELAAELLKVRSKPGALVPLLANRAQVAFEANHRRESVVLKARQMGLSTWIAGRFLLRTILIPGTVTVHVAHTREAATGLFRIVQRMWENLPDALREGDAKRGRNNTNEMSFPALDSEIRIASAAEPNAGRGLTMTNLHCSEVSRWQGDAAETLAGLRAALAPGGELVLESTPNGAFGCFFNEWQGAPRRGAARHFFPWWWERSYAGVSVPPAEWTEEETALAALVLGSQGMPLLPEQIGFRRGLQEQFGAMRVQEFAEDAVSCFRESGSCFFETASIAERLKEILPPLETLWHGALRVYRPVVHGRNYILAADPAGGGPEGDFAAIQIVDCADGVQCAEMQARVRPRELARRIAELAVVYRGALIAVERNSIGAAVLAYLEDESARAAVPLRVYRGSDGQPGWLTGMASRESMLARLSVLLSTMPRIFRSAPLLEECRSFVQKEGGRTEAAAGAHDDLVMAMAIAQAVRVDGQLQRKASR